jgi:hypothetical protein
VPTAEEFLALPEEEQEKMIKSLLHETIIKGDPAAKETAFLMGLPKSRLYQWGSIKSDKVPRPRLLIKLLKIKNNLKILYFLNDLFDLIPFQRPKPLEKSEDIGRYISLVLREVSSVCHEVIDFLEPESPLSVAFTWEVIRDKIISVHRQIASLEEAVRLKLKK